MDFSGLLTAVNLTPLVVAITSIAAIKILPGVARWGYSKVIYWFGSEDRYYQEYQATKHSLDDWEHEAWQNYFADHGRDIEGRRMK